MALGVIGGLEFGWCAVAILSRIRLPQERLYSVVTLTLGLLIYSTIALIGGNGFLAIYIAGVFIGNRAIPHKRSILRFHEAIAWLLQIIMFLTLGLLVFPTRLPSIALPSLALTALLLFIARPVSVAIALFGTKRRLTEIAMISWAGLRGAVPIVLATFPMLAGVPRSSLLFNVVFFVVLVSVTVQGLSIGAITHWLGLNAPTPEVPHETTTFVPDVSLQSRVVSLVAIEESALVGRTIFELGLPPGALIIQVVRGVERLVPSGSTIIEPNDTLLILVTLHAEQQIQPLIA